MKRTADLSAAAVLVTGATGFIGRWTLAALSRRHHTVVALVRGGARREAELRAFVARIGGDPERVLVVDGDIERPGLGLALDPRAVRVVIHLAAKFAFGMDRREAGAANVEGTRNVIAWAAELPRLERFVFVGGYRMTRPARGGDGAYERSKHAAYRLFRDEMSGRSMPWTAVHPSAVIGDSRTGETIQTIGLGETLGRLFEGRLLAQVGTGRETVPIVPVDTLAEILATVPFRQESAGEDLVVLDPGTPTLPELLGAAAAHWQVGLPSRRLPVGLVAALPKVLTGVDAESLGFLVEDRYDTRRTEALAASEGIELSRFEEAFPRACDGLASTYFGRVPGAVRGRTHGGIFVAGPLETSELVALHGVPFDGEAMAPVASRLGAATASIDLPGMGRSSAVHASDEDTDWLSKVLRRRREPAVLVGHSLGAGLAVAHADARPDEVRALILIAPAFLAGPAPWLLRMPRIVAPVLARIDRPAFVRRFLSEASGPALDEAGRAIDAALSAMRRRGAPLRIARALARAASPKARVALRGALSRVVERRIPILVIHAEAEPIRCPPAVKNVVTIPGAGHNPHLTHADAVAEAIGAFLSALPAPRRGGEEHWAVARRLRGGESPPL